jgi:hypothetical protein
MRKIPVIAPDSPLRLFRNFARIVWRHLGLPDPTPAQLDICDYLQYGPKLAVIQAFRAIGKSYLTVAYAAWCLLLNPQELIFVVSASKDCADLFTKFLRRLIDEMPILQHLQPDSLRGDMDSAVSFQVGCCVPQRSPSVVSKGITGQITGSRATIIIGDDLEVPNNSATPSMREKLAIAVQEFAAILLPKDERTGVDPKVRILGTPQTENTVYGVMERSGYQIRIWPVEIPDETRRANYGDRLAPFVSNMVGSPGDPVEPTRFGRLEIESRRLQYGKTGYALQFMLDTSLSDAERYPLKLHDLIIADFDPAGAREVYLHSSHPRCRLSHLENPGLDRDGFYGPSDVYGEITKYEATVLAVDPSGRGADEMAICGASALSGYIFVHSVFGLLGSGYSEENLEFIAREAKRLKAHRIVVEANFGDGMFSQLLRPVLQRIYPCTIEEVKHSIQKERRIIDTLGPVIDGHRMIVNSGVPVYDIEKRPDEEPTRARARQLFHQMTRISYEKGCLMHDDRLDALSIAVSSLAETLSRNAKAEARMREDMEEDSPNTTQSWMDQSSSMSPLFSF